LKPALGFAVAICFAANGALAVEYVNDPLTSDSFPGRGSKGGTFSGSGWTTTAEPDAVWYEIPDALPEGKIEYTVTGISIAGTLTGADHDILTMYQAPTGEAEPIAYNPYFRNNDFKAFTRIFGQQEPGRAGAMKLELAFCPRGVPWHHDYACEAACDGSGLAYANGQDKDVGWDGATAYRMTLEWGGGTMKFSRDGVELGSVGYPGDYAPQPLRIRIGSPRHDGVYPGVAMMPIGLTFKDVLVTGTPGTMTPVCGSTTPDSGVPSVDAGGTDAGPSSSSYTVLADVTAASWETGVFPDANDLNVEGDGTGPLAVVYLRFPATDGVITNARLRVRASADPSAAGGSGIICPVSDDTWDENTMTWASRPAVGTSCAGTLLSVDPDTELEWDITSLVVSGQIVNLAIVSTDTNGAHYLSKEAGAESAPRLEVTSIPGGWSDAGLGGGSSLGGGPGTGATGSGGNASKGEAIEDDSGCGCRTSRSTGSLAALGILGFVALLWRRKRGVGGGGS
jgi:MYXO-CTERM domain-containing protein